MQKYVVVFLTTLFFAYVVIATKDALASGAALALVMLLSSKNNDVNPATTIMMAVNKQTMTDILPYVVLQVAAALAAYNINKHVKM